MQHVIQDEYDIQFELVGANLGGEVRVVRPGAAASYWQPVPANGFVDIMFGPGSVPMEHPFGLGTQTLPPGGHVREHAHDRAEEVLFFVRGCGRAILDGIDEVHLVPGTAIFIGKNRRHMFVNDGPDEMHWLWLVVPNGLEDFFPQIGRPRQPGEPAPAGFERPADVLEIERRTAFASLPPEPTSA